jgi:hypothetical protein
MQLPMTSKPFVFPDIFIIIHHLIKSWTYNMCLHLDPKLNLDIYYSMRHTNTNKHNNSLVQLLLLLGLRAKKYCG